MRPMLARRRPELLDLYGVAIEKRPA